MPHVKKAIRDAVEKGCEVCPNVIQRNPKLSSKQWSRKRYCSFKCGGVALNQRMPSPWNRGLKCPQLGGENHHLWRGGVTPENDKIRHSLKYSQWRDAVFRRDDYTCLKCGDRGVELHADHIKPFAYFPELRFVIDNGQTLCIPCHRTTDTFGHKAKQHAALN